MCSALLSSPDQPLHLSTVSRSNLCFCPGSFICTFSARIRGCVWCVVASGLSRDTLLRRLIWSAAIMMQFAYLAEQRKSACRILRTVPVCDHPLRNIKDLGIIFGPNKAFSLCMEDQWHHCISSKMLRWMVILFGVSHYFLWRRPEGIQSTGSDWKVDFDPCWLCPPTNLWVSFTVVRPVAFLSKTLELWNSSDRSWTAWGHPIKHQWFPNQWVIQRHHFKCCV